ncbi:hypothetical protein [Methylacidimicrobium sp. B4]|uniref:hypothetical protein n=1 Tax=Methylacidimicrobium sp. B4 TaxID=2796139 RepID=UPI001A90064B|nr:hypothetical protein [Methylacidimicrobium sp. B4]QSR84556.1 hypothetical protein MacB4_10220 [Methylacidimicrobium sp. B4]
MVRTKFGEEVDEIVNLSPHGRWLFRQAHKYKIGWGVPGGGSYTDRDRFVIAIDPELKGNPAAVVAALFHELGHATYHPPRVDGDLAHELERLEIQAPKEVGRWVGNLVGKGKEGAELGKRLGFGIEKATEDGCVATPFWGPCRLARQWCLDNKKTFLSLRPLFSSRWHPSVPRSGSGWWGAWGFWRPPFWVPIGSLIRRGR